jgi:glutamate-1-semialdehyde 2,1-aminomutase
VTAHHNFPRSRELQIEANDLIPGGTNSAARETIARGTYERLPISMPSFFERGQGSHIYDVDNNEFIDYHLGFGAIILGHCNQTVNAAIHAQLEKGSIFATNTEIELRLCEKLRRHIPSAEQTILTSTGTEATSIARRLAMTYNKKKKILKFEGHYHGWQDWNMVGSVNSVIGPFARNLRGKVVTSEGISESVADDIIVIPWNDPEILEETIKREGDQISAVITEAYQANLGVIPPERGYLELLRRLTKENDILLIFDEVITGFRLAIGGAQQLLGIQPDITTIAKSVANGLILAGVLASKDIMDVATSERVYFAGTYNGNPLSVAAALATVTQLESHGTYTQTYNGGNRIMNGIRDGLKDNHIPGVVQGPGPMWSVYFTDLEKIVFTRQTYSIQMHPHIRRSAVFYQGIINRRIMAMPSRYGRMYFSFAHTEEDIEKTIEACGGALKETKSIQ